MAIKCPKLFLCFGGLISIISITLQTLLAFVLTLLVLPLIIIIFTPIYLFRFILFKLTPYLRPNFGKILSTRSAMFASDDIYNKPLCTLIGQLVSEGEVDMSKCHKVVQDNLVDATWPNGQLKHPELKQYVTQWFGFCFWKNEVNFKVEEHVKFLNIVDFNVATGPRIDSAIWSKPNTNTTKESKVTESQVCEIMSQLSNMPFSEGKSPWEMLLIPNFVNDLNDNGKPKNVMILRWHHCLMDGFSLLKLYAGMSTLDVRSITQSKSIESKSASSAKNAKKRKPNPSFFKIISTMFRAPYVIAKTTIESMDPISSNSWHVPEAELAKEWKSMFADTKITTEFIKEIKDHYEVSFGAVVLTGITGALRKFMLGDTSRKLPNFIHAGIPFPFKGHPQKLRNYWSICTVKLPIAERDSLKRLKYIDRKLEMLKTSPAPLVTFMIMPLVGGLFNWMIRQILNNRSTTVIVSLMPGPQEFNNYMGERGLQLEFLISLGAGNAGFGFSTLSYNGCIRVAATLDTELFSDISQIKELANEVHHEIHILNELIKHENIV